MIGTPLNDDHTTAPDRRLRSPASRRDRLEAAIVAAGSATPQQLADKFGVSLVTIHRDLAELERRGVVRRFHGGVSAQPSGVFESNLPYRLGSMAEAKQAIADAALRLIEPGSSVLLDDSTTALHLIDGLVHCVPIHVATPFLQALIKLREHAANHDIHVIGLGGRYDPPHDSFLGLHTNEQIQGLYVDAVFMSSSALSGTDVFHQEEQIVAMKRAMLSASKRRYLLIDSTKLHRTALLHVASLNEFDLIITDSGADPEVLANWSSAGISFEIARV